MHRVDGLEVSGSVEECFEHFARHVDPGKARFFEGFGLRIVMGRREGAVFEDLYDNKLYYNCHCNGGVFNLGHRNPEVRQALLEALESLDIGNHHLVSPLRAELARRLAESTDGVLQGAVFTPGGGEAADLAIKLSRGLTGRTGVVSAQGSFHGHTGYAMSAGDRRYRRDFGPDLPGFVQVPFGDLRALEESVGADTACVVLEPIPATLGMLVPEPGYLASVQAICRRSGALLVLDEVQTGLGRTGAFWYFQQEGLRPDMVLVGKGLSGGYYPMAAVMVSDRVLEWMAAHPFSHISSFGGSELGCVAALKVLEIVGRPGFLKRVRELGEYFERELSGLGFKMRRKGMMMGLQFDGEGSGIAAAGRLIANGVFVVYANDDTSCVQFLPPLTASDADAGEIVRRVREALG